MPACVVGLDGHDGTGKTTVASELSARLGGSYQRPFGGSTGRSLLAAAEAGDVCATLAIGERGIRTAIAAAADASVVVLDRSWLTVASLVPWALFEPAWTLWIPTLLCWADLEVTLRRLARRREEPQTPHWHEEYIARYLELARRADCVVLDTSTSSIDITVERAEAWARRTLSDYGLRVALD